MKKIILSVFIVFFTISLSYSQPGWLKMTTGFTNHLYGIHCADATNCYGCGLNGKIIKSTDGGITWSSIFNQVGQHFYDIYFINSTTGVVVGENGMVMRTGDGGLTWNLAQVPSGITSALKSISFSDNMNGVVAGWGNTVIKTSDGGNTWTDISPVHASWFEGAFFTSATNGWVTGSMYTILKTTDGGTTWDEQKSGTNGQLTDLYFTDASNGFCIGGYGEIYKTMDGGTTWSQVSISTLKILNAIDFYGNTGFIMAMDGIILKSQDGGNNWMFQASGTSESLYGLHLIDQNIGLACGNTGTLLRTTSGGDPTGIDEQGIDNAWLMMNTLIRTGDIMFIRYYIPQQTNVQLSLYDLTGKVIKVIREEQLHRGEYEDSMPVAGITPGIYILKMQAGNKLITRKITITE